MPQFICRETLATHLLRLMLIADKNWELRPSGQTFPPFRFLATNPNGEIHCAALFAGILSIMPDFNSFFISFLTFSPQCRGVFLGFLAKKGLAPAWSSTSMGGHCMFSAWESLSTNMSLNLVHNSFSSCGHSGLGHIGVCGSGFCSQGLKHFGVT